MYYVAVDIGCIECGECTSVLGIFTDEACAREVCEEHATRHQANWRGQHSFEVFEVEETNSVVEVKYD